MEAIAIVAQYASRLWRRRWMALAIAWTLSLVGWGAMILQPDRYMSSAQFYVDTENLIKLLLRDMTVEPNVNAQLDMVRRTLLSPSNLDEIASETERRRHAEGNPPLRNGASPVTAARLARGIKIVSDRVTTNLYTASYVGADPRQAQRVVEAVLEVFKRRAQDAGGDKLANARRFIDRQIDEYEERLRDLEARILTYRREHAEQLASLSAESYARQEEAATANLSRLGAEQQSLIWERDQLHADIARTPAMLTAAQAAQLAIQTPDQQRLEKARSDLAVLQKVYTDRYPDIILLKEQIKQMEADPALAPAGQGRSKGSGGGSVQNPTYVHLQEELRRVETKLVGVERAVRDGRARLDELRRARAGVPDVEARLTELTRDHDVLKKNYATLLERRENAAMSQNLETHGVVAFQVIEPPSLPTRPLLPRKLIFPAITAVALGVGLAAAFGRTILDGTVATLAQLRALAPSIPILGTLSEAAGPRRIRRAAEPLAFATALLLLAASTAGMAAKQPDPNDAHWLVQRAGVAALLKGGR